MTGRRYIHIENGERRRGEKRREREREGGREREHLAGKESADTYYFIFMLNLENCCMYV